MTTSFKKNLAFGVIMLLIGTAIMASIDGSKVFAENLTLNIYLDAVSINDARHYDFVIISHDTFYEYDGEWNLERLADWHNQNDALATYVIPVSDIFSNSSFCVNGKWGDGNPNNPFKRIDEDAITNYEMFNDSAAKIRNYLRYANHELGVKYALLVGDTDSNGEGYFPARYVYARGYGAPASGKALREYHKIIPTDMYYACLNGTFNADEDENLDIAPYGGWGENASESSDNIDECDWKWEIAVGRFPVDSAIQLSNAVRKTISYMSLSGEEIYLHNITLGGTKGGWGGAAEWACNYSKIVRGIIYSNWWDGETTYGFNPSNYTISIIDDNPNRIEGVDFTQENVENFFNSGCHIWYQNGHGGPTSWSGGLGYSWGVNDVQSLTNTKYCLVLSPMPCNTANFDNNDDCFMEQWLVDEHGAFASSR